MKEILILVTYLQGKALSAHLASRIPSNLVYGLVLAPSSQMAPPKHCFEKEPLIVVYNW